MQRCFSPIMSKRKSSRAMKSTNQNWFLRAIWRDQRRKMERFERDTLRRFDSIVAVSERDRDQFRQRYDVGLSVIPTGVDLDYFAYHLPAGAQAKVL